MASGSAPRVLAKTDPRPGAERTIDQGVRCPRVRANPARARPGRLRRPSEGPGGRAVTRTGNADTGQVGTTGGSPMKAEEMVERGGVITEPRREMEELADRLRPGANRAEVLRKLDRLLQPQSAPDPAPDGFLPRRPPG